MLWLFFSLDSLSMSWASCLIQLAIWRRTSLQFIFQFQLHCLKTVLNVISFPVWNSTTSFLDNLSLCYFTLNENKIINMCCAIKLSWDDIAIFCRLIGLYLLRKKKPQSLPFCRSVYLQLQDQRKQWHLSYHYSAHLHLFFHNHLNSSLHDH